MEPGPFISCFHGWCDWDLLSKPFIDPRTIRFDQRARMGMLGDMANYIGKPIEGLTTEQHTILAKEYKKKLEKEKKKAAEAKPQKETIRDRVRQAARLKEEEKREEARALAGLPPSKPAKIVPDASFKSDYHVPPPDSIFALSQKDELSETESPRTAAKDEGQDNREPYTPESAQTPVTPQLNQSVSAQAIEVSPLTPLTDMSSLTRDSSRSTPHSDFKRLSTSTRTPPSKTTPARTKPPISRVQPIGLAPPSPKKTPPPKHSPFPEGITQRITHAQPKTTSKVRSASISSATSASTADSRRRSTSAMLSSPHKLSHSNGGTPSSKIRSSSLNWSPEEHNGLVGPGQRSTPRNSIGSASGAGSSTGPVISETTASRLRREKNMSKVNSSPSAPMSLSSSEEKSGRKPYIDYLRQPATPSTTNGEKSITRIITAAGEEVQQRRRSSISKQSGITPDGGERPRRNSSASTTRSIT